MPTYIYHCEGCDSTLERHQSFTDAPLTLHEECGGSLRRVFHAAPVIFKGSGFYSTDHRSDSSGAARSNGKSEGQGEKPEGKGETKESAPSSDSSEKAPSSASSD